MKNFFIIIITSLFLVNCNNSNPMMNQWSDKSAEFGGVPAFDKMNPEQVKEAMLAGMELSLKDIDKIANNLDTPTFENTIVNGDSMVESNNSTNNVVRPVNNSRNFFMLFFLSLGH